MKILVTGATGYVGGALANAFLNGSNQVTGTGRSEARARALIAKGMGFASAALEDPAALRALAAEHEVVIHAAISEGPRRGELDEQATLALIAGAQAGRGRVFVYTSSCWALGSAQGPMDETVLANPLPAGAWRQTLEPRVLQSSTERLRTHVVRPGRVYGGRGGAFAPWFEAALAGEKLRFLGKGTTRWALVHREDLGELYRRVVEAGVAGALYHGTDDTAHPEATLARVMAAASGAPGVTDWPVEKARKELGAFVDSLTLDQHVISPAARRLGWLPRITDVLTVADRIYDEYVASPPES